MNILIDTHVLIWYVEGNTKLPQHFRDAIESPQNNLYVSMVSFWEMSIKISINKLKIACPLEALLPNGVHLLPIQLNHVLRVQFLPFYHSDPFDRLLISQAIEEDLLLMSVDEYFHNYPIQML